MSKLGKAILATLVGGFLMLSVAPKAQAHPWWADNDDGWRYRYSRDWDDDDDNGGRFRNWGYYHHEPDSDDFALLCDSDRDDCRPNPAYQGYRSYSYRPYYNAYQYRQYRSPWSFFSW